MMQEYNLRATIEINLNENPIIVDGFVTVGLESDNVATNNSSKYVEKTFTSQEFDDFIRKCISASEELMYSLSYLSKSKLENTYEDY